LSTLYFIRHGQASYGAADYDVLSPLGVEQSRSLGSWLAAQGHGLDSIYTGPLKRQLGTAEHLVAAASVVGHVLPAPTVEPAFREYPALEIVRRFAPLVRAEEREEDFDDFLAVNDGRGVDVATLDAAKAQRLFAAMMFRWAKGELQHPEIESFADFFARVRDAVLRIVAAQGRGKRIAIVTSGGPVATASAIALGIEPERLLRLSWVLNNASITEIHARDGELILSRFNSVPHLERSALTYI